MPKIAVGRAIAHAYGFFFGRAFQILGAAWFPALIYGAVSYGFIVHAGAEMPIKPGDSAAFIHVVGWGAVLALGQLLLHAVLGIVLTQDAFGLRKDLTLAHFVVGPREIRLFLALIRFYLVFFLFYVLLIALLVGGVVAAKHFAHAVPAFHGVALLPIAVGIVLIVLAAAFVLSMLRLSFLLAPLAAVEHHAPLARSWSLTHGSAWRILVIYAAILLPVFAILGAVAYFLLGNDLAKVFRDMVANPKDHGIVLRFEAAHAFVIAIVSAASLIVVEALKAGAMSEAYRSVTGHEEPETEDDDALVARLPHRQWSTITQNRSRCRPRSRPRRRPIPSCLNIMNRPITSITIRATTTVMRPMPWPRLNLFLKRPLKAKASRLLRRTSRCRKMPVNCP